MEITEEQRVAVLIAECERLGHLIDIDEAISDDPTIHPTEYTVTIRARDDDSIPHIRCRRCPTVWLIVKGVAGYDAAEQTLNEQLQPKHRRKLRRERRRERAAAEQAAAAARAAEMKAAQTAPAAEHGTSDAAAAPAPIPAP